MLLGEQLPTTIFRKIQTGACSESYDDVTAEPVLKVLGLPLLIRCKIDIVLDARMDALAAKALLMQVKPALTRPAWSAVWVNQSC